MRTIKKIVQHNPLWVKLLAVLFAITVLAEVHPHQHKSYDEQIHCPIFLVETFFSADTAHLEIADLPQLSEIGVVDSSTDALDSYNTPTYPSKRAPPTFLF